MKLCFLFASLLLNTSLYAQDIKPCQIIGFDDVAEEAIPIAGTTASMGISDEDRESEKALLKKCIKNYSVCISEAPPKSSSWLNKKLMAPADKNHFNPVSSRLVFGVVQYFDKKSGNLVCIAAINGITNAAPWYGVSWINDGKTIKKYELRGAKFSTVMTPKSLYNSLLASQKNPAIKNRLIKSYNAPKLID